MPLGFARIYPIVLAFFQFNSYMSVWISTVPPASSTRIEKEEFDNCEKMKINTVRSQNLAPDSMDSLRDLCTSKPNYYSMSTHSNKLKQILQ